MADPGECPRILIVGVSGTAVFTQSTARCSLRLGGSEAVPGGRTALPSSRGLNGSETGQAYRVG